MSKKAYWDGHNNVEVYMAILLGVLRYVPVENTWPENIYKAELAKNLKFENLSDPDLLRSCVDVVEDTELAISDFKKYGLANQSGNIGDMSLRLYGILNAFYIQMNAAIDLLRMFKHPAGPNYKRSLKAVKIIQMHNKLGSQTTNFKGEADNRIFLKLLEAAYIVLAITFVLSPFARTVNY